MTATDAETGLIPFAAGYKLTEFRVVTGGFDTIQMSRHRADDIRSWWTESDVPVVLRGDDRHLVPEESDAVGYDYLRVPYDLWHTDARIVPFLVPDAAHTRRLTGVEGE